MHAVVVECETHQDRNPTYFPGSGGLIGYSDDYEEESRLAAGYPHRQVGRLGAVEDGSDVPTKYELVINLKTAKALGLDVPR